MDHARPNWLPSLPPASTKGVPLPLGLLLATLFLLGTGCGSTHHVSQDPSNGYHDVTAAAAGETAHVHLRDGQTLRLNALSVSADSTTGISTRGRKTVIATSAIREVEIVDRGTGTLQGAAIGFVTPLVIGAIGVATADSELDELGAAVTGVLGSIPGALVGGLVGAGRGQRETYRFPNPPRATDAPTSSSRDRAVLQRRRE